MDGTRPSRTALSAAAHRAAHQVLEGGQIFSDPLALPLLGMDPQELARDARERPESRGVRLFIAARSRFAEEALASSLARGVEQLVVLGAGLDTSAYRAGLGERVRIFEVDHPATQRWKRDRLAAAGIALPPMLRFAPVDFEREDLMQALAAAGLDPSRRTFFTWLGVIPYLREPAIWSTLEAIASISGGAHVVFDYGDPPASRTQRARAMHRRRAARAAALGEPWITFFDPQALHAGLGARGFREIEDLGPREIFARYAPQLAAAAPQKGGHVLAAATAGSPRMAAP